MYINTEFVRIYKHGNEEEEIIPVLYSKNQSSLTLDNVKEDAAYECEIIDRANNKSQSIRFSLDTKEDTGTNWTIKYMTYDSITGEYTKEVSANGSSITVPNASRLTGDMICIIEARPKNGGNDEEYDEITCRFIRK